MENNEGQKTAIHLAFSMEQEAEVKQLLDNSEENAVDENGLSHLHIASTLGHLDSIKRYLNRGANVNSRVRINFNWHEKRYEDWKGDRRAKTIRTDSTPLHVAVVFGHKDVVKYLLDNNADVYAQDSMGFTPIHLTLYAHVPISDSLFLLLFKATPNLQDRVSSVGLSHLHVAARENNSGAVDKLLLNGAKIEQVIHADANLKFPFLKYWAGKTPLLVASLCEKSVKSLLRAGANIYAKDLDGVSALHRGLRSMGMMSSTYFIDMVKTGKYEVESCGMTLLHVACGSCDIEWAKKLLDNGADVNARIRDNDSFFTDATPLHVFLEQAVMMQRSSGQRLYNFVKLLLEYGADNNIECNGSTALHRFYNSFCFSILENKDDNRTRFLLLTGDLLLERLETYDVNPVNHLGFSHFHMVCLRNKVEAARKFLDSGVDVNLPVDSSDVDDRDFTPLHFAMAHRCTEVAYLLLENGADVNAEDAEGNTPLHLAIKRNFVDLKLIEIMLGLGADVNAKNESGETPLYCLLGYGSQTLENLEFFLNLDGSINILDAKNESSEGIIGLAMRTAPAHDLQSILDRLAQLSEIKSAIQSGFNTIQSIVAIHNRNLLSLENYVDAITLFINIGCNLDQRDKLGKTALHAAMSFCNVEALQALLLLGVDVNVADNKNECAFSIEIVAALDEDNNPRQMDVVEALACHVWKMRFCELNVKQSNVRCLQEAETQFSFVAFSQSYQDEMAKMSETEICQGLFVKDFLSELGAVAQYPRMWPEQRAIVDKFFKCTIELHHKFPEFCGILAFQYRKALAKMDLWQPANEAIVLICQANLPDLCLEAILRFFTNTEMELLIETVKDLM